MSYCNYSTVRGWTNRYAHYAEGNHHYIWHTNKKNMIHPCSFHMDEKEQRNHTHGSLCRQLGDIGRYFLLVLLFVFARHAPYFSAYFFSSPIFSTTFSVMNWSTPSLLPYFSRPSYVSPSYGSILQLPFWTKKIHLSMTKFPNLVKHKVSSKKLSKYFHFRQDFLPFLHLILGARMKAVSNIQVFLYGPNIV
jgi:hypothetical protein